MDILPRDLPRDLPSELILKIIQYVDIKTIRELYKVKQVSRLFNLTCNHHTILKNVMRNTMKLLKKYARREFDKDMCSVCEEICENLIFCDICEQGFCDSENCRYAYDGALLIKYCQYNDEMTCSYCMRKIDQNKCCDYNCWQNFKP